MYLQDISHCRNWSWSWSWISSCLCLLYCLVWRDSVALWTCCSLCSVWSPGFCGSFSFGPRRCRSFCSSVFFGCRILCPFYETTALCCGPFSCSCFWTSCLSANLWPCSCLGSSSDIPSPWSCPSSYSPCRCCVAFPGCVLCLSLGSFLVFPRSPSTERAYPCSRFQICVHLPRLPPCFGT